ncbi:EFR1 family ferrodoxin [Desulfobacterales bacterium HSG17]|nr:EFR1 family ferrodoxin [Desulfobacterales bacterium HSG17]
MKSLNTSLLYVLSGTGNTFKVANWIKDFLEKDEIKTCISMIENADLQNDFNKSDKQLVSILFPTHGFMPPWSMIKFLFRIPRQKNVPALVVATRGAIWIGPVKIPGAAGFATFFAALILFFKGYDIRGFFSLDMPSNFINFHSSLTPVSVKRISEKSKNRLDFFLSPIMSEQRVIFTLNNLYEGICASLLFWFIPIFPILYLIYGKSSMAKIMFANNNCVSCGMCARFCPNNAIEMKNLFGKKRPFWTCHCENCMRCMGYCNKKAVEAGHSLGVIQYFIVTIPVLAKLIYWLSTSTGFSFEIKNYWAMALLEVFYFLPALFISYWIFWILIRVPLINSFFSVTTLTHYFKRFHEPDTRIKDLVKGKK